MTQVAMPNQRAGQRTRNRFREHRLSEIERIDHVDALANQEGALMSCADQDCDWKGWLPTDELTITQLFTNPKLKRMHE